jgi:hypothetical protein
VGTLDFFEVFLVHNASIGSGSCANTLAQIAFAWPKPKLAYKNVGLLHPKYAVQANGKAPLY